MINQKILDNMSENNDKISQSVNVHDPVNPPHAGFGINVKLKLLNQNCFSITNWKNGEQPSFTLEITDPISLGLENFQENNVDKFMDNVILACNLVLKRGAFSRHGSDSAHATIHRKKEPSIPSKVEDTPTGKKVTIQEVISITESIHIGIGFEDELDENQVIDVLKKIRKINDGTANSNLKIQDLQKSLRDYYSGTTSFDRLSIFKHLFSSLELATNCDGQDRAGSDLDNEISRISGSPVSEIEDFRNFYSRTKHIDKNTQHEAKYKDGMSKLSGKINPLWNTTRSVIRHRLSQVS